MDASLTVQMGYYNSTLALWEPLIEPVAIVHENVTTYSPWEIKFEVGILRYDDRFQVVFYTQCPYTAYQL